MAEMAGLLQIRRELLSVRGKMYLIAAGTQVAAMRNDKVVREHAELVDALERHDCKAARRLVTEHVERSIDAFAMARVEPAKQPRLNRLS
jgi:DNA-binding GntR family transcriptional regulator